MTDPLHDLVLSAIGHQYALEGEIGRGGMAVVYRARDLRLDRQVAIKVLPPELAYDPAIRTRFTREAQTSARLSHAHIVPIYDVGERDGLAYFVMSHVGGGNLAALLAREPRQPAEEVRRLVCQIADALAYAHLRGVIHRDIKPDNILLDHDGGRAMVTDFGIARAIEAGRLTLTGVAVGTPTYMSPEQAVGEREVDGRSDVYSLGVLAYQMLTGRVPFSAGNSVALLMKHVSERPRPIAELRPDAPRALRDAVERALLKSPEDRWPTAAALRDALRDASLVDDGAAASWRADQREPVRYTSPRPDGARAEQRAVAPRRGTAPANMPSANMPSANAASANAPSGGAPEKAAPGTIVLEPAYFALLTPEQRADVRLWHGRAHLLDRVKAMRGYALLTVGAWGASFGAIVGAVESGAVPLILAPLIPWFMTRKLWRRGKSLRESGLRLRRVLLMPRAKWAIKATPAPAAPKERHLEKVAPRELLDGPHGGAIRRAVEERSAIMAIVGSLPKADRALLPDVGPAVNGLVERVVHLAQALQRLDASIDPRLLEQLDALIASVETGSATPDDERRLALLRRQKGIVEDLVRRRDALSRQLDSAGLALGNLRLDLVKLRSSGVQAALSDVSSATQEARALSREIGAVLEAAAEVKAI